ncbi:MAG TPA: hypothetical protein VEC19_07775 [Usitatibacter sp.]|nr:hypothetical protein [Usitatibacter sp.]
MTMSTSCKMCAEGPVSDDGHAALAFYVQGPYPGHHIFKCGACDERWIRHYGSTTERFGWTRYNRQFVTGPRNFNNAPRPAAAS